MASKSMLHWNGDQVCVVDTETTGLRPGWHEIVQICILPLDSNFKPRQDAFPFYIEMKPDHPERTDPKAMQINKLSLAKISQRGKCREAAKELLEHWFDGLGLPMGKYGSRKRIIPLAQNWPFDKAFIEAWLGPETFGDFFHPRYRDTMAVANYLNDHAAMHAETVPFSKTNLAWLAKQYEISHNRAHDALADCLTTAEVYRKMTQRGMMA
jgi:DNA polymerase III epsilon subunit-like protein